MKNTSIALAITPNPLQKLSVYKKALELFTLSRKLKNGLSSMKCNETARRSKLLYEQLLTLSVSLPIAIAQAYTTREFSKKITLQNNIAYRLQLLDQTCTALNTLSIDTASELPQMNLIFKELKSSFKVWSLQLTQQN